MTVHRFAQVCVDLGAVYAVSLDAGGSTTMWLSKTDPAGGRSAWA
jgi:exopolysaccharide biosynthesis protein